MKYFHYSPKIYKDLSNICNGHGVYTNATIHAGEFIGFFSGELVTDSMVKKWDDDYSNSKYAFSISKTRRVIVPSPTGDRDLMCLINEPAHGTTANAFTERVRYESDDGFFYAAIGIWAHRKIHSGQEITVYYGSEYPRDYKVGRPPQKEPPKKMPFYNIDVNDPLFANIWAMECGSKLKQKRKEEMIVS